MWVPFYRDESQTCGENVKGTCDFPVADTFAPLPIYPWTNPRISSEKIIVWSRNSDCRHWKACINTRNEANALQREGRKCILETSWAHEAGNESHLQTEREVQPAHIVGVSTLPEIDDTFEIFLPIFGCTSLEKIAHFITHHRFA